MITFNNTGSIITFDSTGSMIKFDNTGSVITFDNTGSVIKFGRMITLNTPPSTGHRVWEWIGVGLRDVVRARGDACLVPTQYST